MSALLQGAHLVALSFWVSRLFLGSCQKAIASASQENVLATRMRKVVQVRVSRVPFGCASNKSKFCLKYSCLDITRPPGPPPSCACPGPRLVLVTANLRMFHHETVS